MPALKTQLRDYVDACHVFGASHLFLSTIDSFDKLTSWDVSVVEADVVPATCTSFGDWNSSSELSLLSNQDGGQSICKLLVAVRLFPFSKHTPFLWLFPL